MDKLLIICGPTATGKTKLALHLAKKFNGELVSADSRQVYKGLDALTGKDRSDKIPIHLYDVLDPGRDFSVAHFVPLAWAAIDSIHTAGKLPIVVGGTGFYIRALTRPIVTIAIPPNRQLRKRLNLMLLYQLQEELRRVDPWKWKKMNHSDQKNPRRLIRAIEVVAATKISSRSRKPSDILWIGLMGALSVLKSRITQRIVERFDSAAKEVGVGLPDILGVGPLLSYTRGQNSKEETIQKWADAEYAYARRQMTWFRKEKDIHWFEADDAQLKQKVEEFVAGWYNA